MSHVISRVVGVLRHQWR